MSVSGVLETPHPLLPLCSFRQAHLGGVYTYLENPSINSFRSRCICTYRHDDADVLLDEGDDVE